MAAALCCYSSLEFASTQRTPKPFLVVPSSLSLSRFGFGFARRSLLRNRRSIIPLAVSQDPKRSDVHAENDVSRDTSSETYWQYMKLIQFAALFTMSSVCYLRNCHTIASFIFGLILCGYVVASFPRAEPVRIFILAGFATLYFKLFEISLQGIPIEHAIFFKSIVLLISGRILLSGMLKSDGE